MIVALNVFSAYCEEDIARMSFMDIECLEERRLQTNAFLENAMPLPVLLRFAQGEVVRDEFASVGVCFIKIENYREILQACGNDQALLISAFTQLKQIVHQLDDIVASRQSVESTRAVCVSCACTSTPRNLPVRVNIASATLTSTYP